MSTLRLLPLLIFSVALSAADLRLGMVGLDTGHVIEFTKTLHAKDAPPSLAGVRIVGAVPAASRDIESSWTKAPGYTERLQREFGVKIYGTLDELLRHVDGMLIESVDARPHLAQAAASIRAGKPCYIEKPIAASLKEALEIFALAKKHNVPVFSSSALRFGAATQAVRAGQIGRVQSAETSSPSPLEPNHTDLFWYGIHGVERLYTLMGPGCEEVTRTSSQDFEQVVGRWSDGRIGSFRGIRKGGSGYGGTVFGESAVEVLGTFEGYRPLIVSIAEFFRTGKPPVAAAETIELYAFMEAADESKRNHGAAVRISDVLKAAEAKVRRQ